MDTIVKTAWATAVMNPEFICIDTYSGYRGCQLDPAGVHHIAPPDEENIALGGYVLDALSHSRFVLPKPRSDVWIHPEATFDPEFDKRETLEKNFADWEADLMSRFNYKNARALFRKMYKVGIVCTSGIITLRPSHHVKADQWNGDGLSDEDHVVISADSPPPAIGAALRLAFSRCTG